MNNSEESKVKNSTVYFSAQSNDEKAEPESGLGNQAKK